MGFPNTFTSFKGKKWNGILIPTNGDELKTRGDNSESTDGSNTVYSPGNRFKPTTTYTIDKVRERWGIGPNQFIDYLAMVGDSSDNIPGVDGIGAKSAVKLLEKYGKLESVLRKDFNCKIFQKDQKST